MAKPQVFTIYVLKCIEHLSKEVLLQSSHTEQAQNFKYYVGRTQKNKYERFYEHHTQQGSEFTKMYRPLRIAESFESSDLFDEDKTVLKYMNIYGIDNVRGGSYSRIKLSNADIESINKHIRNATDKCFTCGKSGHFTKDCKEQKVNSLSVTTKSKNNDSTPKRINKPKQGCERCGRNHSIDKCFANTDIFGQTLADFEDEDDSGEYEEVNCYKCGREGHYSNTCFAKYDIDGKKL